jgi:hypothetical protein
MPRTDIARLSDDARVWVFGISPALDDDAEQTLLARIDPFLEQWTVHGEPITAAREIRERAFLVIAVEKSTEASGCSIDRLFGTLQQLERELSVAILDANRVFLRHGDRRVDAVSRAVFRENGDAHTVVFDTTVDRLGEVRNGSWERRAEQSWHRDLLGMGTNRRAI